MHSESPDFRALLQKNGRGPKRVFDFLEVYTRGEPGLAKQVREAARGLPLIYHHEGLDPVYPRAPRPEAVKAAAENLRALQAPWCVEELAYRRLDGRYLDFFMPALLTEESIRTAVANIRALNEVLSAPVIPENPPYQLPVGDLHIVDFMALVSELAQVPLVIDLGHLYSFQICRGLEPLHRLDKLPLDRVIELHVAGSEVLNRDGIQIYEDVHGAGEIPQVALDMLADVAPRCENLRAVTIEVEDATVEGALAQAAQVKRVVDRARAGGVATGRLRGSRGARVGKK
ncbi:DUF692 family protein [bacterium]|nr:DUF692 family protein [bacterium]